MAEFVMKHLVEQAADTWKNLGNFEFIESTGKCFADIKNIKEIYDEFLNTTDHIRNRMIQNLEACPGNTLGSKVLHDKEYRDHLAHIHSQTEYYHYLAAYVRWKNTKNMQLMDISEEELRHFIEERDKKQSTVGVAPEQESFRTPVINPDSLPDIKMYWISESPEIVMGLVGRNQDVMICQAMGTFSFLTNHIY